MWLQRDLSLWIYYLVASSVKQVLSPDVILSSRFSYSKLSVNILITLFFSIHNSIWKDCHRSMTDFMDLNNTLHFSCWFYYSLFHIIWNHECNISKNKSLHLQHWSDVNIIHLKDPQNGEGPILRYKEFLYSKHSLYKWELMGYKWNPQWNTSIKWTSI